MISLPFEYREKYTQQAGSYGLTFDPLGFKIENERLRRGVIDEFPYFTIEYGYLGLAH
ncbi:MAG: hypothetical protein EZS28_040171, partial [Streblomastix strix]